MRTEDELPAEADYATTLRAWLAHVATHDPSRRRFGARHHRYTLAPALGEERVAAIEAQIGVALPISYRRFVATVGDGGAGPYHGLFPLDHPLQLRLGAEGGGEGGEGATRVSSVRSSAIRVSSVRSSDIYSGVIGLGHVGCGYVTFLILRGPNAGQVWIDARGAGEGVRAIHPDFTAYFHEWVVCAATNRLPPAHVTAGRCALPSGLSAYLAAYEERAGLTPGTIDGDALRTALGNIGDGGIATTTTGDDPFFTAGDTIDLCPSCEQLVDNLVPRGLRRTQIAPGLPPNVMRSLP
jgi:hypothetical protein